MKIDLHVHSNFSSRPSLWILQKIGCPESFTEPMKLYNNAKKKDMSLVTITDHNSINGALEIAHLTDTFVSEEVTSYFPEDKCKVHVLVYNINEEHHKEIQKLRENIYDLIDWLNKNSIINSIAHPLYSINDKLQMHHFEKLLLLFKNFELNGARDDQQNQTLRYVLENLLNEDINYIENKHNIKAKIENAWQKNLTGGSDDHSGLNIARTYTEVKDANDLNSFFNGIACHQSKVVGLASSPQTMAHNLYSVAYQFYRNKFKLKQYANKDILMRFLERTLVTDAHEDTGLISKVYYFLNQQHTKIESENEVSQSLLGILRKETTRQILNDPKLKNIAENGIDQYQNLEELWFDFVNQISNQVMMHFANHLMDHLAGGNVFSIFHTIGSAGGLYALLAPYFLSFSHFTKDREFRKKISNYRYNKKKTNNKSIKVAHFTDTFNEINGVAITLQNQVKAAIKNNKKYIVITCNDQNKKQEYGIKNFIPIGNYLIPDYEDQKLFFPPFLEILNYCYEENFTHIQSATPGPIGLTALAISKILKLPIFGTYHTSFPHYAMYLTGDNTIEDLTWRYTLWYYDQMDYIYVPSKSTGEELIQKGINKDKIKLFPRGIDIDFFSPSKKSNILKEQYNISESIKLLYVGRVSKEKNLHILSNVFKKLCELTTDIHLIIVGEGPFLAEIKNSLQGLPCTFTGYLTGKKLSNVIASCDIFIFPSTTDTFGNVVLEAQASGLPVIVTDKGGPCENIENGKTGFIVKSDNEKNLLDKLFQLLQNKQLIKDMGYNARKYMEDRSFDNAFSLMWDMYYQLTEDQFL